MFKMSKAIANLADCKIRAVIRFLKARDMKVVEIHRLISKEYGDNAMSDGMVRKRVHSFNEGSTNMHDVAGSGQPSVITDDVLQKVDEKVHETRRFTIWSLCNDFTQVARCILCEIVTDRLKFQKLCSQ